MSVLNNRRVSFGLILYGHRPFDVRRSIESIASSCRYARITDFRIYLLDNHEFGALSAEYVRLTAEFPNATLLERIGNVGFGRGHNHIVARADADGFEFYVALNPDGFLFPSALDRLTPWFDQFGENHLFEFRQMPNEHPRPYIPASGQTQWISGAAFITTIERFTQLGGFDERIFMYLEDVDLSWRHRLLGGKCFLLHNAFFFHDLSDKRSSKRVELQMHESGRYLGWKWGAHEFAELMGKRLVQLGLADDISTLPRMDGDPLHRDVEDVSHIVEFRRLFHFSASRW